MQNKTLAFDYIERARKRLSALQALYNEEAWADVVRQSQEVVEAVSHKDLHQFEMVFVQSQHTSHAYQLL